MEFVDPVMEAYLRLLEAIAENRCRNYRKAYRAWLDRPDETTFNRVYAAEQKLMSMPTNYTSGQIKTLARQVEKRMIIDYNQAA